MADDKDFGYDFTIKASVSGKSQVKRDLDDIRKMATYTDEQLRKASHTNYNPSNFGRKSEADYIASAKTKTRRLQEAFATGGNVSAGDINSLRSQIYGTMNSEKASKEATPLLNQLDVIQTKLRNTTKEANRSTKAWYYKNTATRKLNASLYLLRKRFRSNVLESKNLQRVFTGLEKGIRGITNAISPLALRIGALAAAYFGLRAATNFVKGVFSSGGEMEQMATKSRVFFGNLENTYNAIDFAQKKVLSGQAAWNTQDMMQGMQTLQEVGIDSQKHYGLIADMAGKTGKTFSEAASAVNSAVKGNSAAFESFGIQEVHLRKITGAMKENTPMMKAAVLNYLSQQKQFKNGASEMSKTLDGQRTILREWGSFFKQSIIGRANEPDSLYSAVKNTMGKVIEFLNSNKGKVQAIAKGIGEVFKWVWSGVDRLMNRIIGRVKDLSVEDIGMKFRNIIVWLELAKNKVVRIFDEWGWAFKGLVGVWAFGKLLGPLKTIGTVLKETWSFAKGLYGVLESIVTSMTSLGAALGPILAALLVLKPTKTGEGASRYTKDANGNMVLKEDNYRKNMALSGVMPLGRSGKELTPEEYNLMYNSDGSLRVGRGDGINNVSDALNRGMKTPEEIAKFVLTMDKQSTKQGTFTVGDIVIHIGDNAVMDEEMINNLTSAIDTQLRITAERSATPANYDN